MEPVKASGPCAIEASFRDPGRTHEVFEAACCYFEIVRSQHLEEATRWLYALRKRF
jgi:hypothetical protein